MAGLEVHGRVKVGGTDSESLTTTLGHPQRSSCSQRRDHGHTASPLRWNCAADQHLRFLDAPTGRRWPGWWRHDVRSKHAAERKVTAGYSSEPCLGVAAGDQGDELCQRRSSLRQTRIDAQFFIARPTSR